MPYNLMISILFQIRNIFSCNAFVNKLTAADFWDNHATGSGLMRIPLQKVTKVGYIIARFTMTAGRPSGRP